MYEKDYPFIFLKPNEKTMETLKSHVNAFEMYKYSLPDVL